MKTKFLHWFICAFIGLNLLACDGLDENYSNNPNHRLSFSVDTLSFDTIFTTIGSTTKEFMIYNLNDAPLLVNEVILSGSGESGFRINVDGRKGDHFRDVRIPARDSLYVFVEATINPSKKNQPLLVQDSILFLINGVKQSVLLEAYGQDVNLIKGGETLEKDCFLSAEKPYLIYDSLVISPNVTVTIEAGALFYMHDKSNIVNYGTIIAKGTLSRPIIFRGDRLDFVLNDVLPYDRTPSQWGGIFLQNSSFNNVLDHVVVRNATTGITMEKSDPDRSKLIMNNSQVTNTGENVLSAFNCYVEAINTEFTNAGGSVVLLLGGKYEFIHCTIANFMTLSKRTVATLTMSNNANNEMYPLHAKFDNCIIDGSFAAGKEFYKGELNMSVAAGADFDYTFNHCLLKSLGENNESFKNNIFTSTSPSYRLKGGEKNKYRYDFRPDSVSTLGVGKADAAISIKYPKDRNGIDRFTDQGPTIGAYEYVPQENSK